MIYSYKKYKDVEYYIRNVPFNNKDIEYSLIFGNCQGISENSDGINSFNDKCFGCLFCGFGSMKEVFIEHFGIEALLKISDNAFKENMIVPLQAKKLLSNPYRNIEFFTKVSETKNIQPWAAGLLQNICSTPCRIGMEVHAPNELFNRDGRLDVCAITKNHMLVFETKTTLDDALRDERFVEQHAKYAPVIDKYLSREDYLLAIMFGGKESDLLPSTHHLCTSNIGNKAARFYKLINEFSIPFVSAHALWCLAVKYIIQGEEFQADKFFKNVFKDKNCIGLVSAGKMVRNMNEYVIQKI